MRILIAAGECSIPIRNDETSKKFKIKDIFMAGKANTNYTRTYVADDGFNGKDSPSLVQT